MRRMESGRFVFNPDVLFLGKPDPPPFGGINSVLACC